MKDYPDVSLRAADTYCDLQLNIAKMNANQKLRNKKAKILRTTRWATSLAMKYNIT